MADHRDKQGIITGPGLGWSFLDVPKRSRRHEHEEKYDQCGSGRPGNLNWHAAVDLGRLACLFLARPTKSPHGIEQHAFNKNKNQTRDNERKDCQVENRMSAWRGRSEYRHVPGRVVNRCAEKNTSDGVYVDRSPGSSVRPSMGSISVWAVAAIPGVASASAVVPNFRKSFSEEAADEVRLGGGIVLAAAVRHRLPTAGMVKRILD